MQDDLVVLLEKMSHSVESVLGTTEMLTLVVQRYLVISLISQTIFDHIHPSIILTTFPL